jgi:Cu2+-exporting ATPase
LQRVRGGRAPPGETRVLREGTQLAAGLLSVSAKDYDYQQGSRPRLDSGVRLSARGACRHCGADAPKGEEFCCGGCEAVFALLQSEGLSRYYDLRGKDGIAAQEPRPRDHKWLEVLAEPCDDVRRGTSPRRLESGRQVSLDVQGIHCAACVWLFEQLFKRHAGAIAIVVNPTLGKLDLTTEPPFSLRAFVEDVERFGYALGPSLKEDRAPSSDLTLRIGVCVAIAMNAMIFAVAIYCGLREGPIYRLFEAINFAFGTLSVLVGGTVFFRSAWQAVKHRVLHLDAPIALGILLAYAGSAWAYFARGGGTYFDTLSVFIALMLVGRLLQERVVEKNRRMLLANDGVDGLLTRRLESGLVKVVRCSEIAPGDLLLVTPGDLVVVPGRLEDPTATCSLDWINGESAPRAYARGDEVPAGAFNAGAGAIVIHASVPFAESPLTSLLRATRERSDAARTTAWWQAFARIYVFSVFALAITGFVGWVLATHDVERALVVTAGVLIVTCPCAFGIATPLGYELALAGLRRAGLFVRAAGFLDRARGITKVVFDKTGTLTTGALELDDPSTLDRLTPAERTTLYNLVARSGHPKSQAIARALEKKGALFVHGLDVVEEPGKGLVHGTCAVRASEGDVAFVVDGAPRATFRLRERLRPDARREVESLERAGYEVWILSGDDQKNVEALADRAAVPRARALGGKSPEAKLAFVREHDRGDTLVVGDGLNDSLAVERATCSGTPAIDRPFLPARSDFYFTTPGLRPIGLALRAARALEEVTRRNLAVALAYNVVAVGLAYAGLLSPLVCAVIMPVSSITVVTCTSLSLSPRSALWRS